MPHKFNDRLSLKRRKGGKRICRGTHAKDPALTKTSRNLKT